MKKFLVTYHSSAASEEAMTKATPEEMAKAMEPWMAWNAKYNDQIVDMGAPLRGSQSASPKNEWSSSTKEVSGYSIVQGASLESVKTIFVGHPHLSWHPSATIEIHEVVAM